MTMAPPVFDPCTERHTSTPINLVASRCSNITAWSAQRGVNDTVLTTADSPSSMSSSMNEDCAVFDFAVYSVVVGSLCVFGLVGNALSFVVLQLQRRTDSSATSSATTLLLRALAVADSLVLVVAVPLYALTPVSLYLAGDGDSTRSAATTTIGKLFKTYLELYPSIMPYLWPLYLMPYTATVWLTVLVSADRYAAVCRPFSSAASKQRSGTRACHQVIYVALFAVVYNIPRFFEYQPGRGNATTSASGNETGASAAEAGTAIGAAIVNATATALEVVETTVVPQPEIELSDFGDNKVYRILYANVLYFVVMHGGPILLLAFLNSRLITALKAQEDRKRKMMGGGGGGGGGAAAAAGAVGHHQLHHHQQQQQQQKDLTLTLVVVVFVFIFCQTPTFVDHVLWTVVTKDQTKCGHWHYYYTAVGDLLAILNSSVNFVVYVVASPKFRRGLAALLCRHRCSTTTSMQRDVGVTAECGARMSTRSRRNGADFRSYCRCCCCWQESNSAKTGRGERRRVDANGDDDVRTLMTDTPNIAVIVLQSPTTAPDDDVIE